MRGMSDQLRRDLLSRYERAVARVAGAHPADRVPAWRHLESCRAALVDEETSRLAADRVARWLGRKVAA